MSFKSVSRPGEIGRENGMVYAIKKSWFARTCLLLVGVLLLTVSLGMVVEVLVNQAGGPLNPASLMPLLLIPILPAAAGIFNLWALYSAAYEIRQPHLLISFGLFRWRIPLAAITEVRPKQGFSSDWGWSVALSLDRLVIKYRKTNGRAAFPVIISPENKFGFMLELAEAVPALEACTDGALRLPPRATVAVGREKEAP
jgi:hypothetical protein